MPFLEYGPEETAYLAKQDKRLGEAIEKIGPIQREVIPDIFQALVNSIIGQQISTKAQKTIYRCVRRGDAGRPFGCASSCDSTVGHF